MYENSFTLKKMLAAYGKPLHFSGRSTRTELLGYFVVSWLASTVISWLAIGVGILGALDVGIASFTAVNFLLWLPFPALAVRRFHDQNRQGWWVAPLVLPTIFFWVGSERSLSEPAQIVLSLMYVAALILLFWKPTDGENRYGADPRIKTDDAVLAPE